MKDQSKLFNKEGYISLKEYVENINHMREIGPWKLPLRLGDKVQLALLSGVVRFSWFTDHIYMKHENWYSPAYSVLINYLKKQMVLDGVYQADSYFKDFLYVYTRKNLSINNHIIKMSGYSSDRDIETTLSKSLGEMTERAISGMYDTNANIVRMSPNEIQKKYKIVYPPKYHRFLKVQQDAYRELQHNPHNKIEWVKGKNLVTKEDVYVPRQMTSWLGYAGSRIFKEKLVDQNSNGCAGYFTKEGAALRALLEVVSRDGFLVHWLTMIAPDVIRKDSLPKEMKEMTDEFAARGIILYLLDVTSLAIPSVYIVAINHKAKVPMIVLSGAAGATHEEAIGAALREIVMIGRVFYNDNKNTEMGIPHKPFISDITKDTRWVYWQGKEKIEEFSWFISGKDVSYEELCSRDVGDVLDPDADKLQTCVDILQKRGEDYCPVVYHPKNRVQDAVGFHIAQVYIPKAFPFYLKECYGTFDSDRLEDFAVSKNISNWKLNEEPHMFN